MRHGHPLSVEGEELAGQGFASGNGGKRRVLPGEPGGSHLNPSNQATQATGAGVDKRRDCHAAKPPTLSSMISLA